jgi:hypothetical protein
MAKKRIPRRTPEEWAEFDRETRDGLAYLAELRNRVERAELERARRAARHGRWRRLLTLGLPA